MNSRAFKRFRFCRSKTLWAVMLGLFSLIYLLVGFVRYDEPARQFNARIEMSSKKISKEHTSTESTTKVDLTVKKFRFVRSVRVGKNILFITLLPRFHVPFCPRVHYSYATVEMTRVPLQKF